MRDGPVVRTTLDLDDDVLQAAREIAANRGLTAGKVVSELARKGLGSTPAAAVRNGVPLMPARPESAQKRTMADVNRFRDEE